MCKAYYIRTLFYIELYTCTMHNAHIIIYLAVFKIFHYTIFVCACTHMCTITLKTLYIFLSVTILTITLKTLYIFLSVTILTITLKTLYIFLSVTILTITLKTLYIFLSVTILTITLKTLYIFLSVTILTVRKVGHLNIKTKMFDFVACVMIGWLANTLASQQIKTRASKTNRFVFMLRWPTFLTASIILRKWAVSCLKRYLLTACNEDFSLNRMVSLICTLTTVLKFLIICRFLLRDSYTFY